MTRDCHELKGRIELLAAGELTPAEQSSVRSHLRHCPSCQHQLDEARAMQGLLDVHYSQARGLARLRRSLRGEAGAGRRVLRFAERWAALAALLLVAVGLALLVPRPPVARAAAALPGDLALVEPEPLEQPARGGRDKEAAFVKGGSLTKDFPAAPKSRKDAVPLALRLTLYNPADEALVVALGGDDFSLRLDVRGPGLSRERAPPETKPLFPRDKSVVLPPRGKREVELTQLAEQVGRDVYHFFPARAGEYRLTAVVRARAWPQSAPGLARERTWKAGPVLVQLTPPRLP